MHPNNMEVMTIDRGNGGELSLSRPAETVLKEAQMVAGPWGKQVEALTLYKMIGPSKHLYVEAWQMLGAMYRCTARVIETRHVQFGDVEGFEAFAELYHMPTGQVIGRAEGMCLNDEENWGPRPKYREEWNDGKKDRVPDGYRGTPLQQLRSMAQTRACSKVFANSFKWVARMKGYAGTPAEEMTGRENSDAPPTATSGPARKSAAPQQQQQQNGGGAGEGNLISEPQSKRMYAIAMGAKLSKDDYAAYLKSKGFEGSREVPRDRYDAMIAELEKMGKEAER